MATYTGAILHPAFLPHLYIQRIPFCQAFIFSVTASVTSKISVGLTSIEIATEIAISTTGLAEAIPLARWRAGTRQAAVIAKSSFFGVDGVVRPHGIGRRSPVLNCT